MALLGFLSLSGMLIKNAVVLIDQIDLEIREGKAPFSAILDTLIVVPVLYAIFFLVPYEKES
jgi:multidrug efflux pump subunit AcrB